MPLPDIALLLPPTAQLVSGGNHYNRGLGDALLARGFRVVEWPDRVDAARCAGLAGGVLLVDSVSIEELAVLRGHGGPQAKLWVIAHYLSALDPEASAADRATERERLEGVDGFIAPGEYSADRIRRLWPGVPVLRVEPALGWESEPRTLHAGAPSGASRILCVASLIPCKGVLPLLRELAAGMTDQDAFELHVVGREDFDPRYAERCRDLCASVPALERTVRFRGVVPHAAMPQEYRAADLVVSAATLETFGIALQEARCLARPIFALAAGNVPAHVPAEAGQLFDSHAELASGLLALTRDPAGARELEARARSAAPPERRTWNDAVEQLVSGLDL